MNEVISMAIETSCRAGGVVLGIGDEIVDSQALGVSRRHASELIAAMDELLVRNKLTPPQVDQLSVSTGPGSFTGLRVGITAARTFGQLVPSLKLLAVETPLAIAENLSDQPWDHLYVLLAAKDESAHATLIQRNPDGEPERAGEPRTATIDELLTDAPTPLWMMGEAMEFIEIPDRPDVTIADKESWMPTAAGVWRVGQRMASAGQWTEFSQLLPTYARRPEAVRLWEKRQKEQNEH